MEITGKRICFIITDCLCNTQKLINELKTLKKLGAEIMPIIDDFTLDIKNDIEEICEKKSLHSLDEVKSISHKDLFDIILVVPASENTISKLACDIIDTPATLAVKTHIRNNLPVVIAASSIDGLGANLINIATLINRKNYYFVPFTQSNPITRPRSIIFEPDYILKTIQYALDGEQIEPLLL